MDELKKTRPAAYRRQRQIEDCLFENLLLRPYPSVSISDMCHQLGISRKAFYNYYPDKDSCFRAIINRKLRQCHLAIAAGKPENATLDDVITIFLRYWMQEKDFLEIIVRNNLITMLFDQNIRFLREEDKIVLEYLNTPQLKTDEFVLAAYVHVHMTLVMQWYKGGFQIPAEDMVRKFKRLLYEPLLSL